jgi:hypothetical protein
LAFPDHENLPTKTSQPPQIAFVARNVAMKLICPVAPMAGWDTIAAATAMLVPKATVDKDDLTCAGEHQVRISRKVAAMQSETMTERVG